MLSSSGGDNYIRGLVFCSQGDIAIIGYELPCDAAAAFDILKPIFDFIVVLDAADDSAAPFRNFILEDWALLFRVGSNHSPGSSHEPPVLEFMRPKNIGS